MLWNLWNTAGKVFQCRLVSRSYLILSLSLVVVFMILVSPEAQFILGGFLVNAGYRFQDHVPLTSNEKIEGIELLNGIIERNRLASGMRSIFPRSVHSPKIAIQVCMDSRLDTLELVADTRLHYYVVRTAGSSLDSLQQEMFEMSVRKGVHLIILTRHTDCSAEKIAKGEGAKDFPILTKEVLRRNLRLNEFLNRDLIKKKIIEGKLKVVSVLVHTKNGELDIEKVYDKAYYQANR